MKKSKRSTSQSSKYYRRSRKNDNSRKSNKHQSADQSAPPKSGHPIINVYEMLMAFLAHILVSLLAEFVFVILHAAPPITSAWVTFITTTFDPLWFVQIAISL